MYRLHVCLLVGRACEQGVDRVLVVASWPCGAIESNRWEIMMVALKPGRDGAIARDSA